MCFIIYKREDSVSSRFSAYNRRDSLYHGWDSFYHGIQSVLDWIHFIIAINLVNQIIFFIISLIKIITEGFSLVCFIIFKREDSFYHNLGHKIEGIHFIIDGIHFIIVFIS